MVGLMVVVVGLGGRDGDGVVGWMNDVRWFGEVVRLEMLWNRWRCGECWMSDRGQCLSWGVTVEMRVGHALRSACRYVAPERDGSVRYDRSGWAAALCLAAACPRSAQDSGS